MNLEEHKKIVGLFWQRFSDTDINGALSLLDDDVIWQAMGREGGLPMSGKMDKNAIGQLIANVRQLMPSGMRLTPASWTAEEDRVCVEMESYAEKTNGTVYNNFYLFFVRLKDEKIITIHEYMDTQHAYHVFIADQ